MEFWNRVIFSDECKISLFETKRNVRVFRKPGTEYNKENLVPTVKHGGGSVMIWGCMAASGVGKLHIIDGTMDRHVYLDILKTNLHESATNLGILENFYFQQDNDPKHTAGIVKEWILYNVPHRLETPPQSPNLNPIEHLWAHLKQCLSKYTISNKQVLIEKLFEEWRNISPEVTQKLVKSMPNRLKAVIASKGYPTKY